MGTEYTGDRPTCGAGGRDDAGPTWEVFDPRSGAVVLVTGDREDAAGLAERWGLDFAPQGWGHV